MNWGVCLCGYLAILFLIMGILFAVFKEKSAKFVSGFNTLPKDEQENYDKTYIAQDMRNQCFTWTLILLLGAFLSYFFTAYLSIPFFIFWLFLFFKEFHWDAHKAFEKYLKK